MVMRWVIWGGGLILALSIGIILFHQSLGLSEMQATQVSFLLIGLWWYFFSLPLFRHVKELKTISPKTIMGQMDKRSVCSRWKNGDAIEGISGTI